MFKPFIEAHRQEMIESLQHLLQIPSVQGPPEPGQPFGPGPARALEYVLQLAERHGLQVKNVDGYAGHVEYGEGDEYVAVLSHLDVVPEGDGWSHPPFGAEIYDGKIYARGAIDDKGPALSTLWALLALQANGLRPKRKIRLIFGLDEESGWECVEHYFSKEPKPLGGFTPDADFPLIYAEKGVATLRLSTKADLESMSPTVLRFEGGQRVNMVPDTATAVVDCHSETAAREWEQKVYKEAKNRQIDVSVDVSGSVLTISTRGVSAHGSTPDEGVNAVIQLAGLLSTQPVSNAWMWRFLSGQDTRGRGLGIAAADETTGELTSNLGRALLEDGIYRFWFNIRYPVSENPHELLRRAQEYVSDKWNVTLESHKDPLYVPIDSPVVQALRKVYETCTSLPFQPLAIGGATYARAIPNAVAFGPLFPGQPDLAHQRDEHWALEDYFRCIEIYAHAMLELANIL